MLRRDRLPRGECLYQDHLYDDHGALGHRRPVRPVRPSAPTCSRPRRARSPTRPTPDVRQQRRRPRRAARQAARRRDRVPRHAQHAPRPGQHRVHDRARRQPGEPWRGRTAPAFLARPALPHRPRDDRRAARRGRGRAKTPAPTARSTCAAPVRRAHPARRVQPRHRQGPRRRSASASGTGRAATCRRARRATATAPGGGNSPSGSALFNVGPRLDEPVPDIRMSGGRHHDRRRRGRRRPRRRAGGVSAPRPKSLQNGDIGRASAPRSTSRSSPPAPTTTRRFPRPAR